jgi:hypothetical protein
MWLVTKYSFNMDTEHGMEFFETGEDALSYMGHHPDTDDFVYVMSRARAGLRAMKAV